MSKRNSNRSRSSVADFEAHVIRLLEALSQGKRPSHAAVYFSEHPAGLVWVKPRLQKENE